MNTSKELFSSEFQVSMIGSMMNLLELESSPEDRLPVNEDHPNNLPVSTQLKNNITKCKKSFSYEKDDDEGLSKTFAMDVNESFGNNKSGVLLFKNDLLKDSPGNKTNL